MKKKVILIAAAALVLSIAGYGTWAALNASATATNVIMSGTVAIKLRDNVALAGETGENTNGALDVKPGDVVNKSVYVQNKGQNNCYVRLKLKLTITPKAENTEALNPDDVKFDFSDSSENWTRDADGYYRYNDILTPNEETEVPLQCTITFDGKYMTNAYLGAKFEVLNIAQAVQSRHNTYDAATGSVLDVQGWPIDVTATESTESDT